MEEERQELAEQVLPQFRWLCEERDVFGSERHGLGLSAIGRISLLQPARRRLRGEGYPVLPRP
jgi:hypothetical protein